MSDYLYKPISVISGIGSIYQKEFQKIQVNRVIDLFRLTPEFIYNFLNKKENLKEIEKWKSQASLLQLYGMTPVYSKILVEAGIYNTQYVSFLNLSKLKNILSDAANKYKNLILPNDEKLCLWIKDSTLINYTGSLSGYVINSQGKPVIGAEVKIGNLVSYTDKKGCFRIIRIPFNKKVSLQILHKSYKDFTVSNLKPVYRNNTISYELYKLHKQPNNRKRLKKVININEFIGDKIINSIQYKKNVIPRKINELRPGDYLMVSKFNQTKKDKEPMVTLISRFREVVNNICNIYTWKIPKSKLPDGINRLDYLYYNGVSFRKTKLNFSKFNFILKSRKASAITKFKFKNKKPISISEIDKVSNKYLKEYNKTFKKLS